MIAKHKVVSLFEARFDYAWARIVLSDALAKAGVSGGKEGLDADEVRSIAAALTALAVPRIDGLLAGLAALADAAPAGKGKAAPEPEPEPEPEAEEPAEEAEASKGKPAQKGKKR